MKKLLIIISLAIILMESYFIFMEKNEVKIIIDTNKTKKYDIGLDINESCTERIIQSNESKELGRLYGQKLPENFIVDANGIRYDSNQYKEAPKIGIEPKWNYSKIKIMPIKLGDSTVVYTKCASCHGKLGKTKAMGKSKLLADMDSESIMKKLQAYRDSELNQYGMGTVMQKEVSKMNDNDFKNLINQLKGM